MIKKLKFALSYSLAFCLTSIIGLQALNQFGLDLKDSMPEVANSDNLPTLLTPAKAAPAPTSEILSELRMPSALLENELNATFDRPEALEDPMSRISADFRIKKELKPRVSFWFDIYTKYSSAHHVIHHTRYPWIVFSVVDTTPVLTKKGSPLWMRRQKAEKLVKIERQKIYNALVSLSRKRSYKNLKGLERSLYRKLSYVAGNRKQVFKFAASNIRSQLGQKDFFLQGLRNSAKYLTYMEEEFRRADVPVELTRLPFVESSFNESAESRVGASGIWQIMPRTGKAYVMVNNYVDERNAPLKATRVAAKLMRQNHKILKSWPLAVTAYNHGAGGVKKAMRIAKSNDLGTIIRRYHGGSFKFASSNFYACFLAALHAEKYHYEIFHDKIIQKEKLQVREILVLDRPMRINDLIQITGLSHDQLKQYNLDLKKAIKVNYRLPRGFQIHLPLGYKDKFYEYIGQNDASKDRA